jgi:hypothetical protein
MLDDPKPLSAGAGRKRPPRRFFVVANPNEETVDRIHPALLPSPSPSLALPVNKQTSRRPVRHNLAPSTPTISSRSTSHVIIPQIAPFPPHRLLRALPPLSPPLRQVRPVKRAFLQSNSPRAATAITVRTLLSRALTILSRKSPPHSATSDGNLAVPTCHL